MTEVPEVPEASETVHFQRAGESGRIAVPGHRIDDDDMCTLLVIQETDGSWVIHGLGAPGVRLTRDVMIVVAESILERAR